MTKKATCEEEGETTYTCTRCKDSYTKPIAALGHEWDEGEITKEATCTEKGITTFTCDTCKETKEEEIAALGHEYGAYKIIKEAACEEDGLKQMICERCGETKQEAIPMKGHSYPEEWTVEKEAGFFTKGLKSKICPDCLKRIEEEIPAIIPLPVAIGTGGVIIIVIGGIWYYLKKKRAAAALAAGLAEEAVRGVLKPKFETKTLVTDTKDEELLNVLKKQPYLEVIACEKEELADSVEENGPHIVLTEVLTEEELDEIITLKKQKFPDTGLGLIVSPELLASKETLIGQYKEDGTVIDAVPNEENKYVIFTKLIVPVLKPELSSYETLENIGQLADYFGIPGISTVIDVFLTGREIKETLEAGELGVADKALIIEDLASILGLEQVESVAGLIRGADAVKTSLDKESGAYEQKEGLSAASEIAETVKDLLNQ